MPRVMGVNLLAALAGALAMYFIGFLIYGLLFQEIWTQQTLVNHGVVSANDAGSLTGDALMQELESLPAAMSPTLAMGVGFLISLTTALGVAAVLGLTKPASMRSALLHAVILWAGFAATTLSYNVVYSSESTIIFGIDLVHLFLGYLAAAAVIYAIDGSALGGKRSEPVAG